MVYFQIFQHPHQIFALLEVHLHETVISDVISARKGRKEDTEGMESE
jgi:hypothetical protein